MTSTELPRGIRNNNPGNLRKSDDKWQGLSKTQSDDGYFVFDNPTYGIRALARTLIAYQDKHDLHTIKDLISRWAPASENNTDAYVADIVTRSGFAADQALDMHSFEQLKPVVTAIIWHENGQQPYTDAQLTKALVLAGVEPQQQPLSQSRTVKGGQTAVVATVGMGAVEAVQQSIDPAKDALIAIAPYVDEVKWVLLAITLIGIGFMIWARIDDHNKGLR